MVSRAFYCLTTFSSAGHPYNAVAIGKENGLMKRKCVNGKDRAAGKRLSSIRAERGITQEELAKRLGTAQPIVSNFERGERRLHTQLIIELSRILKVSADELLGIKPSKGESKPSLRLMRRMKKIEALPNHQQQALLKTIDNFLKGAARS